MTVLELRGIEKAFGGLRVTANVNLDVESGERRLIIGPNGAGKTTLFNIIMGELRADAGSIRFLGRDIARLPCRRRPHLGMARTYQIITLFPRETLLRNLMLSLLGLSPLRWNPCVRFTRQAALVDEARAALQRVGLDALADRPLAQTSYGERRRAEIAMALAQRPKLLLLDEPSLGLAPLIVREIFDALERMKAQDGMSVLVVEQNANLALAHAARAYVLEVGNVVVEGTSVELRANESVRKSYLGY